MNWIFENCDNCHYNTHIYIFIHTYIYIHIYIYIYHFIYTHIYILFVFLINLLLKHLFKAPIFSDLCSQAAEAPGAAMHRALVPTWVGGLGYIRYISY